jgi:regulator of protease activity HflC (stomatin/prohibitin superfamily)
MTTTRNILTRAWLAILIIIATACTRIEPGYEGVKVDMLGAGGIEEEPLPTGRVWYNPIAYDVYEFPVFLQRVSWSSSMGQSFTFRSQEGYAFDADVGFGFTFRAGISPHLFAKYRRTGPEIINGPFRDIVREAFVDAASQMGGLAILGSGVTQLNDTVMRLVREELGAEITVEYVNMVGQPRVDARVEASINAVIEATQRANEAEEAVRQSQAEAQQRIAQANGVAEAMRIEAIAKAEAIRIESEALRQAGSSVLQMRAIEKWNGVMPQVVGGDGAVPFINIPGGG